MAQQWLSVVDAAAALGVSPAVLRHRILHGRVVSRFGECGRQVLVDGTSPGTAPPATPRRRRGRKIVVCACVAASLAIALGVSAAKSREGTVHDDRGGSKLPR